MKKLRIFIFLMVFLLFVFNKNEIMAHQPNYLGNKTEVIVVDPEISRAFYGELNGSKVTFNVYSEKEFNLYANLLSPDIKNTKIDFKLEVFDKKDIIIGNISGGEWKKYWEEFARDSYLKGGEFEKILPAGKYRLVLSNPDNNGKYSVAIGKKESFPVGVFLTLFPELIKIKTQIFEKPWYDAFNNIFGFSILILIIILTVIIKLVFFKKRIKIGK
ncbi:MAG: hypothetical protein PHO80_05435 [Candidatus Gracilibacteria bacterium]|nr:hypothetical protein [Candidatus Gracilibacteria bacterium]